MALGIGYGLPFISQHGTNPYKTQWSSAREGAKGAGATVEDENAGAGSCLVARGQEVYTDGLPFTPSLLIVPQFYKEGNLYQDVPPFVAEDTTMRFTVTRATTAWRVNSSGLIESVASGVPRIDWLGQSCPALLVEPSAQNQVRNNSMVGAVTGTPGTLPTNWNEQSTASLNREIVGIGVEDGVDYIDYRISGTSKSTTSRLLAFEAINQIVAASGQIWTHSLWVKVISQSSPPAAYEFGFRTANAAGTPIGFIVGDLPITSVWQRLSRVSTSLGATVERIQPILAFTINNGASYDFTIRIGYPQIELGAVATSPIPTTTAAVTRNADQISASGALVSGLIGQTEGTIYAEVDVRNLNYNGVFFTLQTNDWTADSIRVEKSLGNQYRIGIRSGSSTILIVDAGTVQSGLAKIALAYNTATSGTVLYVNGSLITTQTATSIPVCNSFVLGARNQTGTFSIFLNDRIRSAALYTTRLSNDQLAELTRL